MTNNYYMQRFISSALKKSLKCQQLQVDTKVKHWSIMFEIAKINTDQTDQNIIPKVVHDFSLIDNRV